MLHSVDPDPSEYLHGNSKRKKEQITQRNRQLYRSNPNMTSECDHLALLGTHSKCFNVKYI